MSTNVTCCIERKMFFSFLQYLPSEQNPAYVSQSAKFDPSSKIYEVSLILRFPAKYYKRNK